MSDKGTNGYSMSETKVKIARVHTLDDGLIILRDDETTGCQFVLDTYTKSGISSRGFWTYSGLVGLRKAINLILGEEEK